MIKRVQVDLGGLSVLEHRCNGCRGSSRCCCSAYQVQLTRREIARLTPFLPILYGLSLGRDGNGDGDLFEPIGGGLYRLEDREDGFCVFARRRSGRVRCILHSELAREGFVVRDVKPISCLLWPLALSDDRLPVLAVQEDAYRFPCNTRRPRSSRRGLAPGVVACMSAVFGSDFAQAALAAAHAGKHGVTLTIGAQAR